MKHEQLLLKDSPLLRMQRAFRKAEYEKYMKEEGAEHDVRLPFFDYEQLNPSFFARSVEPLSQAYPKSGMAEFYKRYASKVGTQEVVFIILDTGAISRHNSLNVKGQFLRYRNLCFDMHNEGLFDEHGHFSWCAYQPAGYVNSNEHGLFFAPGIRENWFSCIGGKVLNRQGSGSTTGHVAPGLKRVIQYAKNDLKGKAIVLSCSFGSPSYNDEIDALTKELESLGVIVFAAAGNSGQQGTGYPASLKQVASVGAIDYNKKAASFSSVGKVDYCDFGVQLYGAGKDDGTFVSWSGTSGSTPLLAGKAAIIRSCFKEIGAYKDFMYAVGDDLESLGDEKVYGKGFLFMGAFDPEGASEDPGPEPVPDPVKGSSLTWEMGYELNLATVDSSQSTTKDGRNVVGRTVKVSITFLLEGSNKDISSESNRDIIKQLAGKVLEPYNNCIVIGKNDTTYEQACIAVKWRYKKMAYYEKCNLQTLAKELRSLVQTEVCDKSPLVDKVYDLKISDGEDFVSCSLL